MRRRKSARGHCRPTAFATTAEAASESHHEDEELRESDPDLTEMSYEELAEPMSAKPWRGSSSLAAAEHRARSRPDRTRARPARPAGPPATPRSRRRTPTSDRSPDPAARAAAARPPARAADLPLSRDHRRSGSGLLHDDRKSFQRDAVYFAGGIELSNAANDAIWRRRMVTTGIADENSRPGPS